MNKFTEQKTNKQTKTKQTYNKNWLLAFYQILFKAWLSNVTLKASNVTLKGKRLQPRSSYGHKQSDNSFTKGKRIY